MTFNSSGEVRYVKKLRALILAMGMTLPLLSNGAINDMDPDRAALRGERSAWCWVYFNYQWWYVQC